MATHTTEHIEAGANITAGVQEYKSDSREFANGLGWVQIDDLSIQGPVDDVLGFLRNASLALLSARANFDHTYPISVEATVETLEVKV